MTKIQHSRNLCPGSAIIRVEQKCGSLVVFMKTLCWRRLRQKTFYLGTALVMSQLLVACPDSGPTSGSEAGTNVVTEPTPNMSPLTPPERTICDPFSTNSPAARDRGVVANMVWLDDSMPPRNGQPSIKKVADYFNIGNVVDSTLYFDRVFVPTRKFDMGFFTQDGSLVLNHLGQPMYEYFALHMEGQFQLGPNDVEGDYQVALLADDGAVLKVSDGAGGYRVLVDNDGEHSTKFACPTNTIHMSKDTKLPFVLEYFQGPRYHISVAVMWRLVPDGTDPAIPIADTQCGQQGNSMYWDYNVTPSQAKQPFYELLARGWKVLENENYHFPAQATNPCVPAEDPMSISTFQIVGVSRTSVSLNWTSNVRSDSQVEVRNVATGAVFRTALDPESVTDHNVVVTGLSPNTLYAFKGISVTSGGQTAISDERALRTQR